MTKPDSGAVPGPDPVPEMLEITDAARMRALAHPARLAIIDHLSSSGPATATECAQVVHLSPSATSYHLRALAKTGIIREAESRGDGRERLWRSVAKHMRIDSDLVGDADRAAESALVDAILAWQDARSRQYFATMYDDTAEWRTASTVNESAVLVTPAELTDLVRRIQVLISELGRTTRPEPPPGARRVLMMLRAIPTRGVAE